MTERKRSRRLALSAVPAFTAGVLMLVSASSSSAAGGVTGSAFGYGTFNIKLFGGPQNAVAPTPTATLGSDASNSPQSGSATTGVVQYGPATLFTSDAISVQTSGTAGSKVSSTASVKDINKATTQSSTGSETLTADAISASCSSSTTGNSGSASVTNGTFISDNGPTPPTTVSVPANPGPNTNISGVLHVNSSTDSFHYVFNEQSTSNGVLTVNAVDEHFDGPTLTGNLIIGQVTCGLGATAANGVSGSTVTAPAAGSGGLGLVIGVPLALLGAAVVAGTGVAVRRRARARHSETPD